jgi:hypothetical protein
MSVNVSSILTIIALALEVAKASTQGDKQLISANLEDMVREANRLHMEEIGKPIDPEKIRIHDPL